MLEKTRGIVLHQLKYSENSIIVSVYTEDFGRQSYIVSGVHNKKSQVRASVFQPLFLLDIEVYYKSGRNLQRLKSAKVTMPFASIPYDIKKSSLVIFLSEILNKCLQEEENNQEMFDFIFQALGFLDIAEKGLGNFHLWFLLKLSFFLGISPNNENIRFSQYFDLEKAEFVFSEPAHPRFMDKKTTENFIRLFDISFSNLHELMLTGSDRQVLLSRIIEFYQIHFGFTGELKSLRILKEIFNE